MGMWGRGRKAEVRSQEVADWAEGARRGEGWMEGQMFLFFVLIGHRMNNRLSGRLGIIDQGSRENIIGFTGVVGWR